jgi:hypothetical protein
MNPMSLLTLPASTLQAAFARGDQPSPHGERAERVVTYALTAIVLIAAAMVFLPA